MRQEQKDSISHTNWVRIAGAICRDYKFHRWIELYDGMPYGTVDETKSAQWLRDKLKISSRSELKTNQAAQDRLYVLASAYRKDMNVI